MKLNDSKNQWMYEKCCELQKTIVTMDVLKSNDLRGGDVYKKVDEHAHDLALSLLMCIMGEHIPLRLWSVNDFSEVYSSIAFNDNIELTDD